MSRFGLTLLAFALAAPALVSPALARAPERSWQVSAGMERDGTFQSCLASRGHGAESLVGIAVNADAELLIVLADPAAHLARDSHLDVFYRFDSGPRRAAHGTATGAHVVVFPVPDDALASFASASRLTIGVGALQAERPLAGSASAIRALGECLGAARLLRPTRS